MPVFFARTAFGVGTTVVPAPVPAGTGGLFVVGFAYRDNNTDPEPDTPAHWTLIAEQKDDLGNSGATYYEACVRVFRANVANPDMGFTTSGGTPEVGAQTWRFEEANETTAVAFSARSADNNPPLPVTFDLEDVTGAGPGDAVLFIGINDDTNTVVSTTEPWVLDYYGDIGADGWWARSVAVFHMENTLTPGAVLEAGSITWTNPIFVGNEVIISIAGDAPTGPAVEVFDGAAWQAHSVEVFDGAAWQGHDPSVVP